MSPLVVRVDHGLRLAGCLLAAGDWPEREQTLKPYRPHRLAEGARRALAAHRSHPAVAAAQALAPAQLFTRALAGDWSGTLPPDVADFAANTDLARFLEENVAEWQSAQADLEAVLARADLAAFLTELFRGLDVALVVYPNLLYPGRQPIVVHSSQALVLSQPPPSAWGASPPWRYSERPDEVLGAVAEGLARPLFEQAQAPKPAALALAAAVLFLRRAEGADAADQFQLMEARARQLPELPALVQALQAGEILKPRAPANAAPNVSLS